MGVEFGLKGGVNDGARWLMVRGVSSGAGGAIKNVSTACHAAIFEVGIAGNF